MSYCINCGLELKKSANFCPGCGSRRDSLEETSKPKVDSEESCRHENSITQPSGGNYCKDCQRYVNLETGEVLDNSPEGRLRTPFPRWGWAVAGLVVVIVGFLLLISGVFAPEVGITLNDQLSKQFVDLAGADVSVVCPPNAKFHAGATIVCDVSGVSSSSIEPNLAYIDVVVGKNDQFHALPVTK